MAYILSGFFLFVSQFSVEIVELLLHLTIQQLNEPACHKEPAGFHLLGGGGALFRKTVVFISFVCNYLRVLGDHVFDNSREEIGAVLALSDHLRRNEREEL